MNIKSKSLVAVSMRVDFIPDRNEFRDSIDQRLYEWIGQLGYFPILVPNKSGGLRNWLEIVQPNFILLSGGNDIGQAEARDLTEAELLRYAEAQKLPVLGICRGMQMMAIHAGGKLKGIANHSATRHTLKCQTSDRNFPNEVNSFHNFAIESLPLDYFVTAMSSDGEIEAMSHQNLPWEGWMWHPEREPVISEQDSNRLRRLFHVK